MKVGIAVKGIFKVVVRKIVRHFHRRLKHRMLKKYVETQSSITLCVLRSLNLLHILPRCSTAFTRSLDDARNLKRSGECFKFRDVVDSPLVRGVKGKGILLPREISPRGVASSCKKIKSFSFVLPWQSALAEARDATITRQRE